MRLAFCDDEKYFREELCRRLSKFAKEYGYDFTYYEYGDGYELLESEVAFDLIFMDYRMKNINGIDTVSKLRKRNIKTKVIFVSNYSEVVYDSLKVETFRFLVKPIDENELYEAISAFIKSYESEHYKIFKDVENDRMCRVNESEIIYAEADNVYAKIRTSDNCYRYNKTLSSFENSIKSDCFFRTHRAFLVNFDYIESFSDSQIYFVNGERALITKTKFKGFKNAYFNYLKRKNLGG